MSDELPALLDQARRLAVSLEGTVPEVRCLAATLDALGSADGGPTIDLFLAVPELAQRAEKVAAGLGWKPRRRELGDGEVRELSVLPAAIWVCTPEAREQVAALEARERPMRTLVLGQKPEPPKPTEEGAAPPGGTPAPAAAAPPADGSPAAAPPASPATDGAPPGATAATPVTAPPPAPPPAAAPAAAVGGIADPLLPVIAQLREIAAKPDELAEWKRRATAARARAAMLWLDGAAERQLGAVRLRRELLQAKINPKGAGARGLSAGAEKEVTARAKPLLQRLFTELERGLGNTDGAFLGVPAGTLIRELEELADKLENLDMHIRATSIATRIPRGFEDDINRLVRERLFEHFMHDLKAINDLFQHSGKEVERLVEKEGGLPVVLDPQLAKDDTITSLLDRLAVYRSTHQGDLPRRGFNEYFSQVRKYAMLLMMSASMLGATAVIRSYKEVTIPATLLLVGIGTFNVIAAAREEREEAEQKDREAARNSVKNEMRRILNDVSKQWSTVVTTLTAAQQQNLLDQIVDATGRESSLKGREREEEKARLQVQANGLVDTEKRLGAARERIGKAASDFDRLSRGEAPLPEAPAKPAAGARLLATPKPSLAAKPGAAAPPAGAKVAAAPAAKPAAEAEEPPKPQEPSPAQQASAAAKAKLEELRAKMKAGKK